MRCWCFGKLSTANSGNQYHCRRVNARKQEGPFDKTFRNRLWLACNMDSFHEPLASFCKSA